MFSRNVAVSTALAIALAGSAVWAQGFVPAQPSTNSSGATAQGQVTGPFFGTAPFNSNMGFTPGFGLNSGFTPFANNPAFTGVNGPNPFNVAPGFNGFIPNGFGGVGVNPALANQTGFLGVDAFGNPLFVPGFNNVPQTGFTNGFQGNFGLPFGFNPGFAASPYGYPGYYSGYYGPYGGSYPMGNNGMVGSYDPGSMMRANLPGQHPGVPIAGVNSPPLRSAAFRPAPPGGRYLVKTDPKTPEDMDRARRIQVEETPGGTTLEAVRGNSDADLGTSFENDPNAINKTPAPVYHSPATRDQVLLVQKAEQLMADHPMREGLVVKLASDNVDVQYECNGKTRTETFPAGEVFFFRQSGTLATAATAKSSLKVGDRVMVACAAEDQPRQAVAGSRQETRNGAQKSQSKSKSKSNAKSGGHSSH